MAHFARIDNGVVRQVIVVNDADAPDEATGKAFIASIGLDGVWVQTSYNGTIRGKYAGIGDVWDGANFVNPPSDLPTTDTAAYEQGKADGLLEAAELRAADETARL